MPDATGHIATELEQIRARSPKTVRALMEPLLDALNRHSGSPVTDRERARLAATTHALAEAAIDAGAPEIAVALAGVQADIESIDTASAEPRATLDAARASADRSAAPAASLAPQAPRLIQHPLALLLTVLTTGALSYGAHLAIAARFNATSLIGWLLSASTTLLLLGIMLRLARFLTKRLAVKQLHLTSAGVTVAAMILAASSFLIHYPRLAAPPSSEHNLLSGAGARVAAPAAVGSANPQGAAVPQGAGGSAAGSPASAEPAPISLWWLGETPAGSPTAVLNGEVVAAEQVAAEADTPGPPQPAAQTPSTSAPLGPARGTRAPDSISDQTPMDRYETLLDQGVELIDTRGAVHAGRLTGVNKEGVTLRTNVMMFGQPILAHQFFLHRNIETMRANPDADPDARP